jgi:polyhydroxyalkanoate synthesis regulator phasin
MEAATPLRHPRISVLANAVVVDGLTITDQAVVELVRARTEAGEDPAQVLADAAVIGARVLAREHTASQADFVRAEFEKASAEVEASFADRARTIAEFFDQRVEEVFGPEHGQLATELERLFGERSSAAVQHQLKNVMTEASGRMREDLLKQFSSADGANPLADFKAGVLRATRDAADRQATDMREMAARVEALKEEVAKLQSEKQRQVEVAAEHARSTAKGRPYEEAVADAVDAVAVARGDDCDAVGDLRGTGGRKGDVVVGIDGCAGPARGRIVFEAKNSRRSRNEALAELDDAMAQRDADYAVWVVPDEDLLPRKTQQLREVNGDKLFVVYDPEDGSRLALEVGYALARARVLMAKGAQDDLDVSAVVAETERALGAMEDVRRIKSQLTNASTGIDEARKILDSMAETVRAHLNQIDALVR